MRVPVREERETEGQEEIRAESDGEETDQCEVAGEAEPDEYEGDERPAITTSEYPTEDVPAGG